MIWSDDKIALLKEVQEQIVVLVCRKRALQESTTWKQYCQKLDIELQYSTNI